MKYMSAGLIGDIIAGTTILTILAHCSVLWAQTVENPLARWTIAHQIQEPRPQFLLPFNDVAFGNDTFVAVTTGVFFRPGGLVTSHDGIHWTSHNITNISKVTFGNGKFVGVGDGDRLYLSADGTNWTFEPNPASGINNIEFINGKFFALGNRIVSVSVDAQNWTNSTPEANLLSVAYGNGIYVAAGPPFIILPTGQVLLRDSLITSNDGLNWTNHTNGMIGLTKILFAEGRFVATGHLGSPNGISNEAIILSSTNGVDWSTKYSSSSHGLNDLIYTNNQFVAIGGYFSAFERKSTILISPDGETWSPQAANTPLYLTGITFGRDKYVAVAANRYVGSEGHILYSDDGIVWHNVSTPIDLNSVTSGNNVLVAVGNEGTILRSLDANTWSRQNSSVSVNLKTVRYGNGQFVAIGEEGAVLTSTNGIDWIKQEVGTNVVLHALLYEQNRFHAFGYKIANFQALGDPIYTSISLISTNGIHWTHNPESGGRPFDIAFGNDTFVATGDMRFKLMAGWRTGNYISTNGLVWTFNEAAATPRSYHAIEYGNGLFVALGAEGSSTTVIRSADGRNWAEQTVNNNLQRLFFKDDTFYSFGSNVVSVSENAITWQQIEARGLISPLDVTFAHNRFIAVGQMGTILVSSPVASTSGPQIKDGYFKWPVQTQNNQRYLFESADSLSSSDWRIVHQIQGNGSRITLTDTNAISRQRFYRLRVADLP